MFGEGSRLSEPVGPSIGGRRLAYGRPLETTVGAAPDDRDGPRKPGPRGRVGATLLRTTQTITAWAYGPRLYPQEP